MLDAEGVEHTSASVRERNLPKAFAACRDIVLTEFDKVLLKRSKFVATRVDDVLALFLGDGVHLLRRELRVIASAEAVAAQAIATSDEGDAGAQTLDKALAHALCRLGDGILVGPVAVVLSLFEVAEQLDVDAVAVGAWQIDIIGVVGFEACGHVAPGLGQVEIEHGTQGESLAEELPHVGVVLDVAILAYALDGKVGTLDAFVEFGVGVVVGVHLRIVGRRVVVVERLFLIAGVFCRWYGTGACLYVGVHAVVGQEAAAVGVGLAEGDTDRHHLALGQTIDREGRLLVER